MGGGAARWETQREGRTWLGLCCTNFTLKEMKRSLLQALRSHASTHTGQPLSPPSGSTPGVGKAYPAGWRGRSPRRDAAWANAWKWEPRGAPGPGERWGQLSRCPPQQRDEPGSEGACGGFSCLAPPSQDTSPSSAPSCLPCPCLPFTPPPACPPPCTPAPMPVPAPLPAAPASTPSSQTHSCQPVVVGGGSQRMPSLPGRRRSNWHLSDSCSPF